MLSYQSNSFHNVMFMKWLGNKPYVSFSLTTSDLASAQNILCLEICN